MSINTRGFTLIELMIAITIFSVLLLTAGTTVTQISRLYYKGVIISRTQNASRSIIDDISQTFQFSNGQVVTANDGGQVNSICIGQVRFTYILNKQVSATSPHALWRDKIDSAGSCGANMPDLSSQNPGGGADGKELLETGMRLKTFSVSQPGADPLDDVYDINVAIIYGDDDLIEFSSPSTPENCKGGVTGSQWCALSALNTQIYSRVRVQ